MTTGVHSGTNLCPRPQGASSVEGGAVHLSFASSVGGGAVHLSLARSVRGGTVHVSFARVLCSPSSVEVAPAIPSETALSCSLRQGNPAFDLFCISPQG